jgi:hypothetical protein
LPLGIFYDFLILKTAKNRFQPVLRGENRQPVQKIRFFGFPNQHPFSYRTAEGYVQNRKQKMAVVLIIDENGQPLPAPEL